MLLPSLTTTFKTDNPLNPSIPLPSLYSLHDSSVQFSHSVVFNSLQPHGLQHAKPPCPSPTPRVYSNSCHSNISSSVVPFSSRLQSFPASGSFPVSQLLEKYWRFRISPSDEYSELISFRMDWLGLLAVTVTYQCWFLSCNKCTTVT